MTLERIAQVRHDVTRHEDVNRCPHPVQAAQDVERVMFKAGERPSRKEEVDRDAIGHRVGHCRDASGRNRRLPAP